MKSRIFLIKKLFEEKTDDKHTVNISHISTFLAERGIQSSRSTILRDIELLRDFGLNCTEGVLAAAKFRRTRL
jgi:hypothetical protein